MEEYLVSTPPQKTWTPDWTTVIWAVGISGFFSWLITKTVVEADLQDQIVESLARYNVDNDFRHLIIQRQEELINHDYVDEYD